MKKIFLLFTLPLWLSVDVVAQKSDNNVIISDATEEYRYVKGDKSNPVQVKQATKTIYTCNEYRTSVTLAEFYNDKIEINNVELRLNGNKIKGFSPRHDYHSVDGIFYSDARVCYFNLPFDKKGATGEVRFDKTVLDPRYFTLIFFTEPYFIEKKEVSIVIPKWMKAEIREYNFKGYTISKKQVNNNGDDIYTYTLLQVPALKSEKNAPGPTHIAPHILILNKYAEPDGGRITYFNTLADQYGWYRQLVKETGNEITTVKARAEEIVKGISGDMQKVKVIYQWVQDNIRYIAYEDGIAGFKPDKAQEVLRKKYGDCKGMGNLMAEMLKAIGLDGRLAWLGTNHIAHDYSTPSLCVDNHVICAWIYNGKTYFLDPTEKYIGFDETAERIQGRQALIEDGDKYLLQQIPVAAESQNTSYEKRVLTIQGNDLQGKVKQSWKGESKVWLLHQLHDIKKDKQEEALKTFLVEGRNNYQVSNLKVINLDDYNKDLTIEYDLLIKGAATSFGQDIYIDMDDRKDWAASRIDTMKRKLPIMFPYKSHLVYEVELQLPENSKPGTLPAPIKMERPGYSMKGTFSQSASKVVYNREIMLKKTQLPSADFSGWNKDIETLTEFYNQQLTITK